MRPLSVTGGVLLLACAAITALSSSPGQLNGASRWSYRLVGGSNDREGRLEVRPEGSQTWGTVCSTQFDTNDARVACRALGHGARSSGITYRTVETPPSQPTYFSYLSCTGSEDTLSECYGSHSTGGVRCGGSNAVWLECPSNSQCGTECLAVSMTFAVCCTVAIVIVVAYMKLRAPRPNTADAHIGQQVMVQPAAAYQQRPPHAGDADVAVIGVPSEPHGSRQP